MTHAHTIGIDIGTTGTKVVLLDPASTILAQHTRSSALSSPGPAQAEADPRQWADNALAGIAAVVAESGVPPESVTAIATTGMVPALVVTDAELRPLRPAILQNDARATAQIDHLEKCYSGIDVTAITGSALTQQSIAPTALWLAEHEPDVWARTRYLMGSYDWILAHLGAEPHVEQNWALESGLFAVDGAPFAPAYEHGRIDAERIPPVRRPGAVVGSLGAEAARRTGLREGTALVVGGADHVLSAYAAGVDRAGTALVKLGGAGDILAASDTPLVDARLYLDAHPQPGTWLPNGCMATSGSLIRWVQSLIGGTDLVELDDEAAVREPAAVLCLPYFLGEKSPLHDPYLRGSFAGLHLGHTRADLYRSVLESIAFGFRHHVEVFAELGLAMDRVMVTNGGSKSVLWKQIHADVLDLTLHPVVDHPGASLGAAVLAAVGTDLLDDFSAVDRFVTLGEPVVPDRSAAAIYAEAYDTWRDYGAALTPVSHRLARKANSTP